VHEWALAEAVVSATSQIAEKEGLKEVTEVVLKLGELQQVEPEVFMFALSQLKTPMLRNTEFRVEKDRAEFKCRVCGRQWTFGKTGLNEDAKEAIHFIPEIAHAYIRCPECGSPDFEITGGRGVWIESVKGMKRDD